MLSTTDMIPAESAVGRTQSGGGGLDLAQLLKRRKLLLLLGLAIGAGFSYLYYLRQPPVYESFSRVMLLDKRGDRLPVEMGGMVPKAKLSNDMLLIRSSEILTAAVGKNNGELEKLPSFKGNAQSVLVGGLQVTQIDDTDVLQISFRGSRPSDCKAAIQKVTEAYREHITKSREGSNEKFLTIITKLVNRSQKELIETEDALANFKKKMVQSRNGEPGLYIQGGEAINPHARNADKLFALINTAEAKRRELVTDLTLIGEVRKNKGNNAALVWLHDKTSRSMEVVATKVEAQQKQIVQQFNILHQKLFDLEVEKAQLLEELGPQHPRVKDVLRRMKLAERYLLRQERDASGDTVVAQDEPEPVDFVQEYIDKLQVDLRAVDANIKSHRKAFKEANTLATVLQADVGEYMKLVRRQERLEADHTDLRKELKDIETVQQDADVGREARVIVPATAGQQVGPNFSRIMAIGSVLGLLTGFGLACLIELADKSFRSPDDLMAELAVPVLSHIPFMRGAKKRKAEAGGLGNALITVLRPKSRTAEAYRSVRTALYFSTSGEVNKIVQVTSPVAGDGKSTLAANLAVAIAHSGKRVLLVDADLRRPTVHKMFGAENTVGVATVVADGMAIEDAVQEIPEIDNLQLLTCGRRPDNPSELLLSAEFDELLDTLRAMYDFVVIDSPPILAVTDPASVAARADGVIVTLRLAKRSRDLAKRAVEQLQSVGANILGVVVNGVDSVESYGYRSYSYGGYGYGGYGQGYGGYYASQNGYYDEAARPATSGATTVKATAKAPASKRIADRTRERVDS